ncbi:hypothetical protein [Sphingomonas sp.]|uniref:hypothetical protein n=1 Tax=Sphingomonas sp. TaxID=28214 RepID=UPI002ED8BE10
MAKISELPVVAEPTGAETVVVVEAGIAKQSPLSSLVAAAMAPQVAAFAGMNHKLGRHDDALKVGYMPAAERDASDSFPVDAGFLGWGVTIETGEGADRVAAGTLLRGIEVPLAVAATATQVKFWVYKRATDAEYVNEPPGIDPDDVLAISEFTRSLAALGLTAGAPEATWAPAIFDSAITLEAGFCYPVKWEALNPGGVTVASGAGFGVVVPGALPDRLTGWYRGGATYAALSGAMANGGIAYRALTDRYLDAEMLQAEVEDQAEKVGRHDEALKVGYAPAAERDASDSFPVDAGFLGWGVTIETGDGADHVAADTLLRGIEVPLAVTATATQVKFWVYKRATDAEYVNEPPGIDPDDVLAIPEFTRSLAALGLTAGGPEATWAPAIFDSAITLEAGFCYPVKWEALNAGGVTVASGAGFGVVVPGALPDRLTGWYRGGATYAALSGAMANGGIAYRALTDRYLDAPAMQAGFDALAADVAAVGSLVREAEITLPAMPSRLHLTRGCRVPFFPLNASIERLESRGLEITCYSRNETTLLSYMEQRRGSDSFTLDTDQMDGVLTIEIRDRLRPSVNFKRWQVALSISSAAATGTLRGFYGGDSIGEQIQAAVIAARLAAIGLDVSFHGSMVSQNYGGLPGIPSEARGGRRLGDFTHFHTDLMAPVSDGVELTNYINGGADGVPEPDAGAAQNYRRARNPFIRPATSGETAANDPRIRNGYILDFVWGLARLEPLLGLGANLIDFVIWSAPQNSIYVGVEAMEADVDEVDRLIGAWREHNPNIGFGCYPSMVADKVGYGDYEIHQRALAYLRDKLDAYDDDKIAFLPNYMHQSQVAGYQVDVVSTDGIEATVRYDDSTIGADNAGHIHPGSGNVDAGVMPATAWIANTFGVDESSG